MVRVKSVIVRASQAGLAQGKQARGKVIGSTPRRKRRSKEEMAIFRDLQSNAAFRRKVDADYNRDMREAARQRGEANRYNAMVKRATRLLECQTKCTARHGPRGDKGIRFCQTFGTKGGRKRCAKWGYRPRGLPPLNVVTVRKGRARRREPFGTAVVVD